MSEALLTLEGVHTHIAQYHILHGVDFEVPRGELTMLLGRNGAGKTTTLRTIMGLWQASKGRVSFDGADITKQPTPAIASGGIAYVPENMGILPTSRWPRISRWPRARPRASPRSIRSASNGFSACSRR